MTTTARRTPCISGWVPGGRSRLCVAILATCSTALRRRDPSSAERIRRIVVAITPHGACHGRRVACASERDVEWNPRIRPVRRSAVGAHREVVAHQRRASQLFSFHAQAQDPRCGRTPSRPARPDSPAAGARAIRAECQRTATSVASGQCMGEDATASAPRKFGAIDAAPRHDFPTARAFGLGGRGEFDSKFTLVRAPIAVVVDRVADLARRHDLASARSPGARRAGLRSGATGSNTRRQWRP